MRIYLLRHGDAPYDESCGERSLSTLGKEQTKRVIAQHRDDLSQLELIICSPTLRARQTLAVVTETLGYQGELIFEQSLRSEGSVASVESYVDNLVGINQLLLLSHQPLIGNMLEYLTDQTGTGIGWSMSTSSLACLDAITFGRGCADLRWLTHPSN